MAPLCRDGHGLVLWALWCTAELTVATMVCVQGGGSEDECSSPGHRQGRGKKGGVKKGGRGGHIRLSAKSVGELVGQVAPSIARTLQRWSRNVREGWLRAHR